MTKKQRQASRKGQPAMFACGSSCLVIHRDADQYLDAMSRQGAAAFKRLKKEAIRVLGPKEGPRMLKRVQDRMLARASMYVEIPRQPRGATRR